MSMLLFCYYYRDPNYNAEQLDSKDEVSILRKLFNLLNHVAMYLCVLLCVAKTTVLNSQKSVHVMYIEHS